MAEARILAYFSQKEIWRGFRLAVFWRELQVLQKLLEQV